MSAPAYATLDSWIAGEAIPFSLDAPALLHAAIDTLMALVDGSVDLLGFGEALHGGEEILLLRNRLFARLVEAHGFRAIAVESSFPRARIVDAYIAGCGPASCEEVLEAGFSHGFGRLAANRELVEWMRDYNADPSHRTKLRFYGFDSPTEMTVSDSPRKLLAFVLDYLEAVDPDAAMEHRERIEPLLGPDAAWENPAAAMDPSQSIGGTAAATELRGATEDLIAQLHIRRPELVPRDASRYREAMQYASVARQLLDYHAALARESGRRINDLLGMRDAMMADNLAYMVEQERGRVFAFAHNSHLKRGQATMQLGPHACAWWPAGAHLEAILGARYAVIGSALGASEANGIGLPEPGTLEARLMSAPGPARFIPTHRGEGAFAGEATALATRAGSVRNPTYFPLTPHSLADFDALGVLDETGYTRDGPPLP